MTNPALLKAAQDDFVKQLNGLTYIVNVLGGSMSNLRLRAIGGCLSVALVFWFVSGSLVWAQDDSNKDKPSPLNVAHELANPNTSLGFLAFILDYSTYDGDLPDSDGQDSWRLSFQPTIPYPLGKDTNLFVRPLIPIFLDQPVFVDGGFESEGVDLGDISFDIAIGKGFANGVQIIGGMAGNPGHRLQ